jgi:hypothetical protein
VGNSLVRLHTVRVFDAADADADHVHEQLAALNVRTEKLGGDVLYVEVHRQSWSA